jgi:hypothetical protein
MPFISHPLIPQSYKKSPPVEANAITIYCFTALYPEKRTAFGTNIPCTSKTSLFRHQNRDKPSQQKGNIPENATKPGQTVSAERKCPGKRHKSRRKQKNGDPQASII